MEIIQHYLLSQNWSERMKISHAIVDEKNKSPLKLPFFKDLFVSKKSRWVETIWYFDATTAGCRDVALHWKLPLAERGFLTDQENRELLEQAKCLFWSIIKYNQRGKNPKVATYPNLFSAINYLIRWMAENGISKFSELNPTVCADYLDDISDVEQRKCRSAKSSLAGYVDILCRVYEQSVLFSKTPDLVMLHHPFGGRTANEAVMNISGRYGDRGFIPPVPDPIFLGSMNVTLQWLDIRSVDVIELQEIHLRKRADVAHLASNSYSFHINKELSKYEFDWPYAPHESWSRTLSKNTAIDELRDLFGKVRDAAIIAIQGMLGLRISEICGILAGDMKEGALWPSCVNTSPSISGLTELFHLRGRVFKQQDEFVDATWLAGSRPMGSKYIPPAVRAITVLWRLFQPWRDLANRKELLVSLKNGRGFPRNADSIDRVLSGHLRASQNRWIKENVEIPPELRSWRVSTHQWRKSFANYMVRTDARLIHGVRDHFKHMSIAMTERGYLGTDPEMLGLIDDEATHAASKFIIDVVNGRPAAGNMTEKIYERRDVIEQLIGTDGTEDERISRLARLLKEDDVRVWPSPWGNCLFLCERARCHYAAKGSFDLSARHPHYGERRPGVCCECANFLVFSDNLDFWHARYKRNLVVYEANRNAGEFAASAVAAKAVLTSMVILQRFGVEANGTFDEVGMGIHNENH
ncbi:hypothetical protein Brsp07_03398 [Brucella sp. NBRC 14130]